MSIRRIKTIAAGMLLGFGLPIGIICTIPLLDQTAPPDHKVGAFGALVLFGLTPTVMGSWLIYSNLSQGQRQARDRLQGTFFKLLREHNGHINVLRFSMEANISGEAAKAYLDERAREFNASFNVTEEGKLFYTFDAEFNQPLWAALPGEPTYDVVLEFFPDQSRRDVVKAIHDLMGVEWDAAKDIAKQVKTRPMAIAQNVNRATAEDFRQQLETVGARILIVLR